MVGYDTVATFHEVRNGSLLSRYFFFLYFISTDELHGRLGSVMRGVIAMIRNSNGPRVMLVCFHVDCASILE